MKLVKWFSYKPSKYFIKDEKPVVIEIDTTDLEEKIFWEKLTKEKPWEQPNLQADNIWVFLKATIAWCFTIRADFITNNNQHNE